MKPDKFEQKISSIFEEYYGGKGYELGLQRDIAQALREASSVSFLDRDEFWKFAAEHKDECEWVPAALWTYDYLKSQCQPTKEDQIVSKRFEGFLPGKGSYSTPTDKEQMLGVKLTYPAGGNGTMKHVSTVAVNDPEDDGRYKMTQAKELFKTGPGTVQLKEGRNDIYAAGGSSPLKHVGTVMGEHPHIKNIGVIAVNNPEDEGHGRNCETAEPKPLEALSREELNKLCVEYRNKNGCPGSYFDGYRAAEARLLKKGD